MQQTRFSNQTPSHMSAPEKTVKELFNEPEEKFTRHLALPDNERIIFSGMYGMGKTTFLRHYFKENKDRYNVIHLYPVNYSILTEEDIMEYIKYDILCALLFDVDKDGNRYATLPKINFKELSDFSKDRFPFILSTLVLLIPQLGWRMRNFIDQLTQLKKDFDVYRTKQESSDYQKIKQFTAEFSPTIDIRRNDDASDLIFDILTVKKEKEKENVLIIDDLDRIDPHHIFRLFNIFAAHFDSRDELPNKFGFDKVIFVCDINNIKAIFRNNYGTSTDFNGYIDKFYSKRVFYFGNVNAVRDLIENVVKNLTFDKKTSGELRRLWSLNDHLKPLITDILRFMLSANLINLRSITRYYTSEISIPNKSIRLGKFNTKVITSSIESLYIIEILQNIIGDGENLIEIIEILQNEKFDILDNRFALELSICSLLIVLEDKKFNYSDMRGEAAIKEYEIKSENKSLEYKFNRGSEGYWGTFHSFKAFDTSHPREIPVTWNLYFSILLDTLKYLKKKSY